MKRLAFSSTRFSAIEPIATVSAPDARSGFSATCSAATPTSPATTKAAIRMGTTPQPSRTFTHQPAKAPTVA